MEQQDLIFDFKARYYKLGKINSSTRQIWFVLHGHGQLAQFFVQKFNALEQSGICVIAPEGLSRYYLEGFSGRVGSTWMTKENRLMDIENYVHYLNALYTKEIGMNTNIPLTVLGFSQGAATASRWILDGKVNFKRLILWAGIFPPDMNFEKGQELLKDKEVYMVYGKSDPFLNDNSVTEMRNISSKLQVDPVEIIFDGKHELDEPTLLTLV